MWEKNKGITECDKNTVTCDVGIAQYHNGTVKCKEKLKYHQMWERIRSNVMLVLLNVTMEPSNVRKK